MSDLPTVSDMILTAKALRQGWAIGRRKRLRIRNEARDVLKHPEAPDTLKARAQEVLGLLAATQQPHGAPNNEVRP